MFVLCAEKRNFEETPKRQRTNFTPVYSRCSFTLPIIHSIYIYIQYCKFNIPDVYMSI